jgi:exodeoxyribonuclease VIII
MEIDGPTLYWWLNQSDAARQELLTDTQTILVAIARLSEWMGYISEFQVWGNGASFDLPKLKNAFVKCGYTVPWHHYNERDVRTMVMLRPEVKKTMPFIGTKHIARFDCRFQIAVVSEIYSLLNPAPIS